MFWHPLLRAQLHLGAGSLAGTSSGKSRAWELMELLQQMGEGSPRQKESQSTCQQIWAGSWVSDSSFLPELLDRRQNVISCSFHSKTAVKV